MNNELEAVLDLCLAEIEGGKSDINACLARYPEHAEELQPLLRAATKLARGREVMPDPSYKARARTQLSIYMQQHPQRRRISPVLWRFAISFAAVVLLFLASGIAFAQEALPGDALYNWKLSSESVWRMTAPDQLSVDLTLSNRRVSEIVSVSSDAARRERAITNYEKLLVKFSSEQDPTKRERIRPILTAQRNALIKAGVLTPELEAYFPR
jgi:hypothetical protein